MGLNLTRNKGQRIIISDDIFISYIDSKDKYTIILAIDSPRRVNVIHVESEENLSTSAKYNKYFSLCFPLRLCQSVVINKLIYISPIYHEEGIVNFFIEAPKFIHIYREELVRKRERY